MLKNYFKIAIRNLRRNAAYSVINVMGLALGLACTIFITLWVQDELSFNKFHKGQSQLFQVKANTHWGDVATLTSVPAPLNEAMKKGIPEVQYVTTISDASALITVGSNSFKEAGSYATPDILKMFSFPLISGSIETALSSPNNIVITDKLAKKYFGKTDVVGEKIMFKNKDIFQVTAVLKDLPANSSLKFNWLIPFEVYEKKNAWLLNWGSYSTAMYVMLKPNASFEAVNKKLLHFIAEQRKEDNKDEIFLQPLSEIYLYSNFKDGKQNGGRIEYVRLFSVVAFFVLVIACINFMNLTTARSTKRAKEVGIRKVVGAERKMIVGQFMGEATLLTVISVLISIVIVFLLMPYFNEITSKSLALNLLDPMFVGTLLTITAITILLSGSYPSFFLSSFKPIAVLKNDVVKNNSSSFLRKGLVVLQFTLSIILISGTLIVYQQIQFIKTKNIGLDKNNLVIVPADGTIYDHLDAFQEEIKQSGAISEVTISADNPIEIDGSSGDLNWDGKGDDQLRSISATWVGYNYLKTVGIPLVAGRDFSKSHADKTNYIINETAAKLMNMKDPLGKTVSFWSGKGQIVGIVKDFHLKSLHEAITPLILVLQPENSSIVLIKTKPGKSQQAIEDIGSVYKKYNPTYPFEYHFMDQVYEEKYKSEMMIGQLGNTFAILTIFISCLGLFGLAAFTAEQRRKEIGIRKVLGATVSGITTLLSKDFLKLVLLSILIATPVSVWAMHQWLEGFAYSINIHWWMFALTGLLAVVIAFATVSFQAIKAAIANPVKSLRTE